MVLISPVGCQSACNPYVLSLLLTLQCAFGESRAVLFVQVCAARLGFVRAQSRGIYTNMSSFMSTELPKGCLPAEEMVGEWKVLEDIEDIHKNRQSFVELVKGEIISEAYQLLGHKQSEDPDEEDLSRSAFYHEFLMKNKVLLQSFLDDHA